MASVDLQGIEKRYPNGHVALRGVDLPVADGELLVLVGPSGCGKSTALRIVAGLESPTRGRVRLGERDVTDLSPGERDVAMVFQSYALYPHKSVRDNLGFGLRMRGVARDEIARRVRDAAERLGLAEVLERRPAQLSGGQRQRVARGRALVREPAVFLLDEPLSNLDAKLRLETRAELARLHRALRATMLYVTHDQEEAMTLGDRVAVLGAGRLEQVAAPLEIYRRPATAFVADFIGVPRINWFEARIEREAGGVALAGAGLRVVAPPERGAALVADAGREIALGIRPDDLERVDEPDADLRGEVEVAEALGNTVLLHLRGEAGEFRVLVSAEAAAEVGARLCLRVRRDRLHCFDAESGARLGDGPT